MGKFEETAENLIYAFNKIKIAIAWAASSIVKRIIFLALLIVILLSAQFTYLNHLLNETRKSAELRSHEIRNLEKEISYKSTLDVITSCIDATNDKSKDRAWYCNEAVVKYKQASVDWPQNRINEVSGKLAYYAMRSDVSHYIRSIDLDRLTNSPATKEEELLKLLLSNTVIGLWITGVVFVISGAIFLLYRRPKLSGISNA